MGAALTLTTAVTPDGLRLAYRRVGAGPPLVCQPGGPGRAAAYLEDLAGLSATRTLLLVDARGTGASASPADPRAWRRARPRDAPHSICMQISC